MGVSTGVFGYWLVIAEYRELGIQIPRISWHGLGMPRLRSFLG